MQLGRFIEKLDRQMRQSSAHRIMAHRRYLAKSAKIRLPFICSALVPSLLLFLDPETFAPGRRHVPRGAPSPGAAR
jgi:hypothetical protein